MAQYIASSINPQANVLTPQEVWDSGVTYSTASYVYDRGAIWVANARNTDSRPVSGNTDWEFVAGTPYVDVVLDPVDLTTAPFYDPTSSGPGVVALSGTSGKFFGVTKVITIVSPGDVWGDTATTQLGLVSAAAGLTPIAVTSVDDQLGSDLSTSDPWVINETVATENPGIGSTGVDLVIWTTTDLTAVGTVFGTRSLFLRIYYALEPGDLLDAGTFFRISAVNQGTKTLTISPTPVSTITPPETVTITGSTGNDGTYTALAVTATTIRVKESLASATGDGWVEAS